MTTHQRITTCIVVALGLATSVAPAAARPIDQRAAGSNVAASVDHTPFGDGSASAPPAIVRISAHDGGFDWGDAGIGAASGFALSMIGLGGALAVSQRRISSRRGTGAVTG
jgi:hypothetical protein